MTLAFECWFDFASTYTYPTVMRMPKLAAAHGIEIVWRPFLLGAIFQAQGWQDSPFNIYPVKGRYMWRDLTRLCQWYDIPFHKPTGFPRNGLLPSRIICANPGAPWLTDFIQAVFTANFVHDQDISQQDVIAPILQKLSLDSDAILTQTQAPEVKNALRLQTEEAIKREIFGAPTITVGNAERGYEVFWGNDRVEHAIAWYLDPASLPSH